MPVLYIEEARCLKVNPLHIAITDVCSYYCVYFIVHFVFKLLVAP